MIDGENTSLMKALDRTSFHPLIQNTLIKMERPNVKSDYDVKEDDINNLLIPIFLSIKEGSFFYSPMFDIMELCQTFFWNK